MKRILAFVVAVSLLGCGRSPTSVDIMGPFFNRAQLDPEPPVYAQWYSEIETCLGVEGDFNAVRWFVADSIVADPRIGRRVGLWSPPDTITIVRGFEMERFWLRMYMMQQVLQTTETAPLYDENGRQRCPP